MTTKQREVYGPQLLAMSSAWIQEHITPGGAASAPSQPMLSTVPTKLPSLAYIGIPVPASLAVGGVVRMNSLAAVMGDPPRLRSSAAVLKAERRSSAGG